MKRYQRQIILSEVGQEGQDYLRQSRVLIIGAGGLGTPAGQYLAAAGVGRISIMDGDLVQESNLHRQVLFTQNDLGKNKAQVLAEKFKMQNDDVEVEAIPEFLTKKRALELFDQYSLIVDGTDNFASKFLINDVACLFDKPVVFAAISQFEGHLSTFWKSKGPCYRCLNPNTPKSKIGNCAEAGVLGPLPGILGSMQAMEAIKVLLFKMNEQSSLIPLIGSLQIHNFSKNESRIFRLKKNQRCLCNSEVILPEKIEDIDRSTLQICEYRIPPRQIVDVRTIDEWNDFHIEGSCHWPMSLFERNEIPQIDIEKKYYLICQTGARAYRALQLLNNLGYLNFAVIDRSVHEYSS